jgi:hypothetical protein
VCSSDLEAGLTKAGRYRERLQSAFEALERGRFDDAKRMVQPVLRDVPNVAEIDGQLPTEVDRTQILTFGDLEECLDAVERLGTEPQRSR